MPSPDLCGRDWSANLESALNSAGAGLSRRQLKRRVKMLSRLG